MIDRLTNPDGPNWPRRLLTTPALVALACLSAIFFPLAILPALIVDLLRRTRWSATRTLIFLPLFFWYECFGLLVLFGHWCRHKAGLSDAGYAEANRTMQRWWVKGFFALVTGLYGVKLDVDGQKHLLQAKPAVILVRHASTLDSLLPFAISPAGKRFRYILKSELLLDPALDYCGQRLPNAFVRRGAQRRDQEIARVLDLAHDLGPNDALVLYPEGTRFSETKRRRLLEKYADDPAMHALVNSLSATLPPLREGALQLLAATDDADVVFIAHRGLDQATTMADLIGGGLTGAHLEVCIWRIPAAQIDRSAAAIRAFLSRQWQRVDAVASGGALPAEPTPQTDPSPTSTSRRPPQKRRADAH